ncbi:hypothetical protein M747DRAFT_249370 [Aspergillus niger ATCC 13496]|uniref:Uncharacterized protein n=3 Tax=Aspergillus niger TaxID=5061 RepID=A2R6J1_ASPNC|nr:hypothetical protein An16g00190 [Aspergillus niger]RDH14544.1 hypothetical protein M747DRAFT_249370 [Aspergillus niger ATCC 13496]CAK42699.1 hypothetical protein An16g00190 [Aspergillus niger]
MAGMARDTPQPNRNKNSRSSTDMIISGSRTSDSNIMLGVIKVNPRTAGQNGPMRSTTAPPIGEQIMGSVLDGNTMAISVDRTASKAVMNEFSMNIPVIAVMNLGMHSKYKSAGFLGDTVVGVPAASVINGRLSSSVRFRLLSVFSDGLMRSTRRTNSSTTSTKAGTKTAKYPARSYKKPPTMGPANKPTLRLMLVKPMARPMCCSPTVSSIRLNPIVNTMAVEQPCRIRARRITANDLHDGRPVASNEAYTLGEGKGKHGPPKLQKWLMTGTASPTCCGGQNGNARQCNKIA